MLSNIVDRNDDWEKEMKLNSNIDTNNEVSKMIKHREMWFTEQIREMRSR